MKRKIEIKSNQTVPFSNQVDFCVGTGRMGLALQKEYLSQLKMVQKEIGFQHIRGHGLFSDDMAIYQEYESDGKLQAEYNFTYLDLVMDQYREVGLKPFLELGFMPAKLASGTQTVFYWKGNTTPPKDYDAWCALVQATLLHLMDRYGREEVVTWPVEIWNEPNLSGFWENADKQEYFKLFHRTFLAVKEVDARFQVGGPAVCGGDDEIWIRAFLEYCSEQKLAIDCVTRHHYTSNFPVYEGHYGYITLMDPEDGFANLKTTRDIIDDFPEYRGLPIHVTEFNTSYIPNAPIHDTNENAAFLALQLSRLGDVNESYSYWTFGDIFEEQGVPFTPFHGGFGMVANGCIPKPTFYSFSFFKRMKKAGGSCVARTEHAVILQKENGDYHGVLWNHRSCGNPENESLLIELELPLEEREYSLVTRNVDEVTCNPLKCWHDLGEPANLSEDQKELLRLSAQPEICSSRIHGTQNAAVTFELRQNAVLHFELSAAELHSDRGYDYQRVMNIKK